MNLEFGFIIEKLAIECILCLNLEWLMLIFFWDTNSVMFERLAENGREFEEQTKEHINEYADAGLRTLILEVGS